MRAEGTEPSSLMSGEKAGLKRSSAPSSPQATMTQGVVAMFVEVHDHIVGGSLYDNAPFMSLSAAC
jgi:hypothetical protein